MMFGKFSIHKKIKICLTTAIFAVGFLAFSSQAQAATQVFYSVGQNTDDHKTGTPTVTVSGTTATFSVAQTATNMGVGDLVTYTGGSCYISSKTSTSVWGCQTVTGGTPTAATDASVTSIAHAFSSLSAAISGASDASHLNTTNLVTGNYQLNIPCYYDTGADSTPVIISGFTTGANNIIKIYTPYNILTEVNQSQRHSGKWEDGKFKHEIIISTTHQNAISISNQYVTIDGLLLRGYIPDSNDKIYNAIQISSPGNGVVIKNNVIKLRQNHSYGSTAGIKIANLGSATAYAFNNIIYAEETAALKEAGISIEGDSYGSFVLRNNTVENCSTGINNSSDGKVIIANNNISANSDNADYVGTFSNTSSNNLSSDATAPGTNALTNQTLANVAFVSAASGSEDLHIQGTSSAKSVGVNLTNDTNLPFSTDIDSGTRGTTWDIGADQITPAQVFYSVGQSIADLKTGTPTVTIAAGSAVFSVAQTGNIGVGDRVTYDTDKIAYIAAKTNSDGLHWNLVTATGSVPSDISNSTVVSIKHEFTSLSAAVTAASNSTHLNNTDLVTANVVLNLPCYYDSAADTAAVAVSGYTTGVSNYIKIYTPNNTSTEANNSQRHQGKWDDGKYKLTVSGNNSGISNSVLYTWVDGLQISLNMGANYGSSGISNAPKVSNSIVKSIGNYVAFGIVYRSLGPSISQTGYIYNNLVYDIYSDNSTYGYGIKADYEKINVYNNTIFNSYIGIKVVGHTGSDVVAKNNIVQNCTDGYSGTFNSASNYNISNLASDNTGGANDKQSTIQFSDPANKDFHLAPNDTVAKNQGTSLESDPPAGGLAFNTDIDNQTRSGSWDIGADEAATPIYYSVGQNTSSHETGAGTVTVDATARTATFSVAQTATNMGVGDLLTYTGGSCYISSKTSTSVWGCQTATGGAPTAATNADVTSIAHAFNSLNAAVTGASSASYLNTSDLVAGNYQLNFPCYYDTGADTTAVTVQNYTTGVSNYIKIYTPNNIATEVNQSQRHNGKAGGNVYKMTGMNGNALTLKQPYTQINGLEIYAWLGSNDGVADSYTYGNYYAISNMLIHDSPSGRFCINLNKKSLNSRVYNNILYNCSDWGMYLNGAAEGSTVYNNTVYGSTGGIYNYSYAVILKNNLAYNNTTDFSNNWDAGDYNNLSKDATAGGTNPKKNQTVAFADAANKDFHLALNDTAARNTGVDLSADANFVMTTDIDGQTRPAQGTFDIGADEAATAIYYSVGQNTSTHETGSGTVTVDATARTATFSVAQTATNMGVGDLVTYTGGSCYISSKTSTSVWGCQSAIGGAPTAVTNADVTSIAHAFSSLNAAVTGASGASYLNTSDLVTGNYQLNIPCYYDTGADTTAVTVQNYITGVSNYIKIYTPINIATEVNQSQRHQGKWDDGKYQLSAVNISYPYHAINIAVAYLNIDGLQIVYGGDTVSTRYGIHAIPVSDGSSEIKIVNNIIKGDLTKNYISNNIHFENGNSQNFVSRIYNNIIYDAKSTCIRDVSYKSGGLSGMDYIYNNTVYNCAGPGISTRTGDGRKILAKNNLVQNTTSSNYDGTFDASSTSNISSDATAPGTNSKINTVAIFADIPNKDFHLSPIDTAAKNAGTSLAADSGLAFTTDIDGQTRPNGSAWDIGADEAANNVFYSVGQSTADLKTGTPTLTLTAGAAVFSVAQTGNIGVGDRVTYDTDKIAYIAAKTNSDGLHWNLVTATGAIPGDISNSTVVSIKHEYTSLSSAVTGAYDSNHINNVDLITANVQLNIPCYYDSGADTAAVSVSGYATSVPNYIKIYTPFNTSTEANNSQRHQGKAHTGYYMTGTAWISTLYINNKNVVIDGLEIDNIGANVLTGISIVNNNVTVNNSMIHDVASHNGMGIVISGNNLKIFNNIIYNITSDNGGAIIDSSFRLGIYIYNNTIVNCKTGIKIGWNSFAMVKNNLVNNYGYNSNYSDFGMGPNMWSSSSANNISSDETAPGVNTKKNKKISFANADNKDFHLASDDTVAKGAGTSLAADSAMAFTTDIDGQTRNNSWDIGADQGPTKIFYSVGQNTDDHKTCTAGDCVANPLTVSVVGNVATFSAPQTAANMGVGDLVTYTGGTCFVAEKISTLDWKCQTATGGVPTAVSGVAVTSIAHAFTSLNAAITGASGVSFLGTSDLVTGNYQLNIPCYYDTGADTTAVTVQNYITSPSSYIKIYTPNSTTTEVNVSQRHVGKWNESVYYIVADPGYGLANITVNIANVKIDGLEMKVNASANNRRGIEAFSADNLRVSNVLMRGPNSSGYHHGIRTNNTKNAGIWNNIVFDFTGEYSDSFYGNGSADGQVLFYNNTSYHNTTGFTGATWDWIAKNNIAQGCTDGFGSGFNSASDYNISDLASDTTGGAHDKQATVSFVDVGNLDFHLANTDNAARDAGADLSADVNLPIKDDIDGQLRPQGGIFDIGADEAGTTTKINGHVKVNGGVKIKKY